MLLLKQKTNIINFDEEDLKLAGLFLGLTLKEIKDISSGLTIIDKSALAKFTNKHKLSTVYKKNVFYFEDNYVIFNIENLAPIYNYEIIVEVWAWLNEQDEYIKEPLEKFNSSIVLIQSEVVDHRVKMERLTKEFYNSFVTNTFISKKLEKELKRLKLNVQVLSGHKLKVYKSNLKYNNIIYNNIILYIEDWKIIDFEIRLKGNVVLNMENRFQIRIHPKLSMMDMPYGFNGVLSWCIGNYTEYADSIYNIFYPTLEANRHIAEEDLKLNILKLRSLNKSME